MIEFSKDALDAGVVTTCTQCLVSVGLSPETGWALCMAGLLVVRLAPKVAMWWRERRAVQEG